MRPGWSDGVVTNERSSSAGACPASAAHPVSSENGRHIGRKSPSDRTLKPSGERETAPAPRDPGQLLVDERHGDHPDPGEDGQAERQQLEAPRGLVDDGRVERQDDGRHREHDGDQPGQGQTTAVAQEDDADPDDDDRDREHHGRVHDQRQGEQRRRHDPALASPRADRAQEQRGGPQERQLPEQDRGEEGRVQQDRHRPPAPSHARDRPVGRGDDGHRPDHEQHGHDVVAAERPQQRADEPGQRGVGEREGVARGQHRHVERDAVAVPELAGDEPDVDVVADHVRRQVDPLRRDGEQHAGPRHADHDQRGARCPRPRRRARPDAARGHRTGGGYCPDRRPPSKGARWTEGARASSAWRQVTAWVASRCPSRRCPRRPRGRR